MKKQAGFTLIELIVVIVILGILAAYAIPKYMNLDMQARISVVQGLSGGVRAAADMVHSVAVATSGVTLNGAGTVNTGTGANIALYNGYPDATATGINAAIADTTGFSFTAGASAGGTANYLKTGASGTNCYVNYTPPATAGTTPTITYGTGNC